VTDLHVVKGHRRYTKRQKVHAIIAAEMTSEIATAEASGIPRSTLRYWMDDPEFAPYRQKTREDLAEGSLALANETLGVIRSKLDSFEPRDLTILWGVLTDKSQLLTGQPTNRTVTTITDGLDDHEKAALRSVIDAAILEAMPT